MFERIKHMLIKEFLQCFRDPKMRGVIFVAPVFQLLVFGYAVTLDIRNVSLALLDYDNTAESRELASRFERSGYFHIVDRPQTDDAARELVDRGSARLILKINKGFSEELRAGRTAPVQVLVDGTDSNTAGVVLQYSAGIVGAWSQELLMELVERQRGAVRNPGEVVLDSRAWFNENLESRNFYVPGVVALLVTLITLQLTSMAVVREKEIGTMEQIIVTPIRPVEFILGKTVPFALIGLFDAILVMVIGIFWFDIPVRGPLPVFFLGICLYLLTSLGVGLLISTVSNTQQQAMMGTFFFFMPVILLSGFMFPIANMPPVVQWLTTLNPMRYFLVIIRGVFLKGVGLDVLWPEMVALAVLGLAILWMASRRFHKTQA